MACLCGTLGFTTSCWQSGGLFSSGTHRAGSLFFLQFRKCPINANPLLQWTCMGMNFQCSLHSHSFRHGRLQHQRRRRPMLISPTIPTFHHGLSVCLTMSRFMYILSFILHLHGIKILMPWTGMRGARFCADIHILITIPWLYNLRIDWFLMGF